MLFDDLYLGNSATRYAFFFAILIVALLLGKFLLWICKNIFHSIAQRSKNKIDDILVSLLQGPVLLTIFLVAVHYGKVLLLLSESVDATLSKILVILAIINGVWYLMRISAGILSAYVQPITSRTKTDLDDHLLPLLRRLINFAIFAMAAIMIVDKLGYNVSSLVAGLGIGGLAFALAAQDLLGNLFGGVAIIFDKPFKLGDRIKVGTDIDGNVTDIGLRTTRVRTFDGTQIVVPNKRIIDSVLENVSKEKARRMVMIVGVEYETTMAKMEKAKALIVKNVKAVKGLLKECNVSLVEFGDSSLNFRVTYWIDNQGMKDYWGVQDKLLMGIKRDFEKAKIEFAFPSRTVYLRK